MHAFLFARRVCFLVRVFSSKKHNQAVLGSCIVLLQLVLIILKLDDEVRPVFFLSSRPSPCRSSGQVRGLKGLAHLSPVHKRLSFWSRGLNLHFRTASTLIYRIQIKLLLLLTFSRF